MTAKFRAALGISLLLIPPPAYASGDGGIVFFFAGVFILLPLLAASGAAWAKRAVMRVSKNVAATWTTTLTVSFLEFCVGVGLLLTWWNADVLGIICLGFYYLVGLFLNRMLCSNWHLIPLLTAIPIFFLLVLLIFGPFGDFHPAVRFAEVIRNLF